MKFSGRIRITRKIFGVSFPSIVQNLIVSGFSVQKLPKSTIIAFNAESHATANQRNSAGFSCYILDLKVKLGDSERGKAIRVTQKQVGLSQERVRFCFTQTLTCGWICRQGSRVSLATLPTTI
ncbi:uncharacterized protein LOC116254558 [Nymphaea colorata]|uniref:uncharacterized protein LOC116254558 n=1 Tax=Nymphaea colorata TaxID=210225 RepID=UPI00129DFC6F|nr:uncharacterized protein LOC116254558 [Nymphaea colorata]